MKRKGTNKKHSNIRIVLHNKAFNKTSNGDNWRHFINLIHTYHYFTLPLYFSFDVPFSRNVFIWFFLNSVSRKSPNSTTESNLTGIWHLCLSSNLCNTPNFFILWILPLTLWRKCRVPLTNLSSHSNNSDITFRLTGLTRKRYTILALAKNRKTQSLMMENINTYLELAEV